MKSLAASFPVALLIASAPSLAYTTAGATCSWFNANGVLAGEVSGSGPSAGGCDLVPVTGDDTHVSSSGHGEVTYGTARLTIADDGSGASARTAGGTYYDDFLTIDSAGHAGQKGSLDATLYLTMVGSSSIGSSPNGQAYFFNVVWLYAWADGVESRSTRLLEDDLEVGQPPYHDEVALDNDQPVAFGTPMHLHVGFTFGTPFELTMNNYSETLAGGAHHTGTGSLQVDMWQNWGGFSNVLDANGQPVDYSVVSDSGTNWALPQAAVPEPATLAMQGAGLLALVSWVARRRRAGWSG